MLALAYLEFRCLQLTSIPYLQTVKKFKVCRCPVPFCFWFVAVTGLSQLQRLDLATDGFFLATMFADHTCKGERFDRVWHLVMKTSVFHYVGLSDLPFRAILIVSAALMYAQMIYPILLTTPKSCNEVDYIIGETMPDGDLAKNKYHNILGESMNLGDSLHILSEPMGSCSLSSQKPSYPKKKTFDLLKQDSMNKKESRQALEYVRNTMVHGVAVIGTVAFLENSIQTNLQVTVFAISRSLSSDDSLWQRHWISAMVSICLSLAMSLEKVKCSFEYIEFADEVFEQIQRDVENIPNDSIRTTKGSGWLEVAPSLAKAADSSSCCDLSDDLVLATWYKRVLGVLTIFLILTMVYATVKFYMVFRCETPLWNITGCVSKEELERII